MVNTIQGPNPLNKTYGDDIIFQNTSYSNVVKVYDLPDSAKIIGQRYSFEFNSESKSSSEICDATNPVTFNIKTIRLKRIIRIAN